MESTPIGIDTQSIPHFEAYDLMKSFSLYMFYFDNHVYLYGQLTGSKVTKMLVGLLIGVDS